jgi:putative Holliday junction resolvase
MGIPIIITHSKPNTLPEQGRNATLSCWVGRRSQYAGIRLTGLLYFCKVITASKPAIGLDIGAKRTGVAISDPGRTIASPMDTVQTPDLLSFMEDIIGAGGVEFVVVGEPKQMDGTPSESEPVILKVIDKIRKRWPDLDVFRQDERFTSKMASRTLVDMGVPRKKRRNKELLDQISAAYILQGYLDRRV